MVFAAFHRFFSMNKFPNRTSLFTGILIVLAGLPCLALAGTWNVLSTSPSVKPGSLNPTVWNKVVSPIQGKLGGTGSSSYQDAHGLNRGLPGVDPQLGGQDAQEQEPEEVFRFDGDEVRVVEIRKPIYLEREEFFRRYDRQLRLAVDNVMVQTGSATEVKSGKDPSSPPAGEAYWSWYQQTYKGLKVQGTRYALREKKKGMVDFGIGRIVADLQIDIRARFSKEQAIGIADQDYQSRQAVQEVEAPEAIQLPLDNTVPVERMAGNTESTEVEVHRKIEREIDAELVISTKGYAMKAKDAAVVWKVEFPKESIEVNVQNGEIWNRISKVYHLGPPGTNVEATGYGLFDFGLDDPLDPKKMKILVARGADGKAYLSTLKQEQDPGYPLEINLQDYTDKVKCANGCAIVDSDDNLVFDRAKEAVGVSILGGLQKFIKYLRENFKNREGNPWIGFDGGGSVSIIAKITTSTTSKRGAEYDGESLIFSVSPAGTENNPKNVPAVSLTAIGHEFTHGIVRNTVGLLNTGTSDNEPGNLNEGLANILAIAGVRRLSGFSDPKLGWSFLYDEYAKKNPDKYEQRCVGMIDPHCYQIPKYYQGKYWGDYRNVQCDGTNDWCGVHDRSYLFQHWYYALAVGLEGYQDNDPTREWVAVPGIGEVDAAKIVFEVLRNQLVSPAATFAEMRKATAFAAESLFGSDSKQFKAVNTAWYYVGVGGQLRKYFPVSSVNPVEPWPAVLSWDRMSAEGEGSCYDFEIAKDALFTKDVQREIACGQDPTDPTRVQFTKNLVPNTEYYWHVRYRKPPIDTSQSQIPNVSLSNKEAIWGDTQMLVTAKKSVTLRPISTTSAKYSTGDAIHPWGIKVAWEPPVKSQGITGYRIEVIKGAAYKGGTCEGDLAIPPILVNDPHRNEGTFSLHSGQEYTWTLVTVGPENLSNDDEGNCEPFRTGIPTTKILSPLTSVKVSLNEKVKLAWQGVPGAKYYEIEFRQGDKTYLQKVAAQEWERSPAEIFPAGSGDIRFKVRPVGEDGLGQPDPGAWTPEVTLNPRGIPVTLVSPANGVRLQSPILLKWNKYPGATSYVLQLTMQGAAPMDYPAGGEQDSMDVSALVNQDILGGKSYQWRVKAFNESGDLSDWSETHSFVVGDKIPGAPILNAVGAVGCGQTVTLSWQAVEGVKGYRVNLCAKSKGTCVQRYSEQTSLSVSPAESSEDWTGYTWTVRGIAQDNSEGPASALSEYGVQVPAPQLLNPAKNQTQVEYAPSTFSWTMGGACKADQYWLSMHVSEVVPPGKTRRYADADYQFPVSGGQSQFATSTQPSAGVSWQMRAVQGGQYKDSEYGAFFTKDGPVNNANPTGSAPSSSGTQQGGSASCPSSLGTPQPSLTPSTSGGGGIQEVPPSVTLMVPKVEGALGYQINYVMAGSQALLPGVNMAALGTPAQQYLSGTDGLQTYLFEVIGTPPPGYGVIFTVQAKDACGKLGPASVPFGAKIQN